MTRVSAESLESQRQQSLAESLLAPYAAMQAAREEAGGALLSAAMWTALLSFALFPVTVLLGFVSLFGVEVYAVALATAGMACAVSVASFVLVVRSRCRANRQVAKGLVAAAMAATGFALHAACGVLLFAWHSLDGASWVPV